MFKILLDTSIIVALITLLGVVFSSLAAPLILDWIKKDLAKEEEI